MSANLEQRRMAAFLELPHERQIVALVMLHKQGMSDSTIASASGLSVEMVRRLLGEANQGAAS